MISREEISEIDPNILLLDGYDDAFLGITSGAFSKKNVAIYSIGGIIQILINDHGFTEEMAEEWFWFNIEGAYYGEYTPLFVHEHMILAPPEPYEEGDPDQIWDDDDDPWKEDYKFGGDDLYE